MHNAAFAELKLGARYSRLAAWDAQGALQTAKEIGMRGLNVTSPFKEEMAKLANKCEPAVTQLRAANTIVFKENQAQAYNTDVAGVSQALRAHGLNLSNRNVLVLGAGGAARAVVYALLQAGAKVTIANRTWEKAKRLAQEFETQYEVRTLDLSSDKASLEEALKLCSIIVACLSTCEEIIDPALISPSHTVLDAYYVKPSALVKAARAKGASVIDATEWLLFQGAQAFELFTDNPAPLAAMRTALKHQAPHLSPRISLIGFMGTGKSEVARELSKLTALPMVDLDAEIQAEEKRPIAEIFSAGGEAHFRQIEHKKLAEVSKFPKGILSCGGGVVLRKENRWLLRENFLNVWLWAKAETIYQRVGQDESRPVLNHHDKKQAISDLLAHRLPLYAEVADLIVSAEGRSAKAVALKIAENLRSVAAEEAADNHAKA